MTTNRSNRDTGTHSDYCFLNTREDNRLSDVERLTMIGGASLDRVLMKLGRSLAGVSLDDFAPGLDVATLKTAQIKLSLLRESGDMARLFAAPSGAVIPTITPVHGFPDGGVYDLEFPSPFPERGLSLDPSYVATEENTTSYVRLWEHREQSSERVTVIAIHGWTMGDQRVNSLAFLPGLFFSLGCNVALVELPFHGRRRPQGIPENLPLFPSADPIRTCTAMAHALYDLRALAAFLKSRGHTRLSCVGMSLGAYVGALWASLDPLERAVFMVPLVSMGDMAFDLFKKVDGAAISRDFLLDLFRDHSPLERTPATRQESIMVIGGEDDHLVPKAQISLLHSCWPRVTIVWAKGGHGATTNRSEVFDRIAQFLIARSETK